MPLSSLTRVCLTSLMQNRFGEILSKRTTQECETMLSKRGDRACSNNVRTMQCCGYDHVDTAGIISQMWTSVTSNLRKQVPGEKKVYWEKYICQRLPKNILLLNNV